MGTYGNKATQKKQASCDSQQKEGTTSRGEKRKGREELAHLFDFNLGVHIHPSSTRAWHNVWRRLRHFVLLCALGCCCWLTCDFPFSERVVDRLLAKMPTHFPQLEENKTKTQTKQTSFNLDDGLCSWTACSGFAAGGSGHAWLFCPRRAPDPCSPPHGEPGLFYR